MNQWVEEIKEGWEVAGDVASENKPNRLVKPVKHLFFFCVMSYMLYKLKQETKKWNFDK